jgi:hypothetical protein
MMTAGALVAYRIRLEMNPEDHEGLNCLFQLKKPVIWRGTDVSVEIGLFNLGVFCTDISNFVNVILEIHPADDRAGAPLIQKTVLKAAMNAALTEVKWDGGLAADCHASFTLTAADTNFDFALAMDNKIQLWLVVHAELTGSKYITLGTTILTVEEDATNSGLPVIGSSFPNFRLTGGNKIQFKNPTTGKWYTLFVDGAEGAEQLTIEAGET